MLNEDDASYSTSIFSTHYISIVKLKVNSKFSRRGLRPRLLYEEDK